MQELERGNGKGHVAKGGGELCHATEIKRENEGRRGQLILWRTFRKRLLPWGGTGTLKFARLLFLVSITSLDFLVIILVECKDWW